MRTTNLAPPFLPHRAWSTLFDDRPFQSANGLWNQLVELIERVHPPFPFLGVRFLPDSTWSVLLLTGPARQVFLR